MLRASVHKNLGNLWKNQRTHERDIDLPAMEEKLNDTDGTELGRIIYNKWRTNPNLYILSGQMELELN